MTIANFALLAVLIASAACARTGKARAVAGLAAIVWAAIMLLQTHPRYAQRVDSVKTSGPGRETQVFDLDSPNSEQAPASQAGDD